MQVDLAIALDSSGSVMRNNWERLLRFTQEFISLFRLSPTCSQVAVISFGNNAHVTSRLNTYSDKTALRNAVSTMLFRNERTHTGDAIQTMTNDLFTPKNGDRAGVVNIGVIFVDGPANVNNHTTAQLASEARAQGIQLVTVGLENGIDRSELLRITNSRERNLEFGSFLDLDSDQAKTEIFDKVLG